MISYWEKNVAALEHRNSAKYKKNRARRTPAALPTADGALRLTRRHHRVINAGWSLSRRALNTRRYGRRSQPRQADLSIQQQHRHHRRLVCLLRWISCFQPLTDPDRTLLLTQRRQ